MSRGQFGLHSSFQTNLVHMVSHCLRKKKKKNQTNTKCLILNQKFNIEEENIY